MSNDAADALQVLRRVDPEVDEVRDTAGQGVRGTVIGAMGGRRRDHSPAASPH